MKLGGSELVDLLVSELGSEIGSSDGVSCGNEVDEIGSSNGRSCGSVYDKLDGSELGQGLGSEVVNWAGSSDLTSGGKDSGKI